MRRKLIAIPAGPRSLGTGRSAFAVMPHLLCFEVGGLIITQTSAMAKKPDAANGCLVVMLKAWSAQKYLAIEMKYNQINKEKRFSKVVVN